MPKRTKSGKTKHAQTSSANSPFPQLETKPGETRVIAGGTGFGTANKSRSLDHPVDPELKKVADEASLTPEHVLFIGEMFEGLR